MKEICKNIFQKTISYKSSLLSPRNLYVISGSERSLMVDTSLRLEHDAKAIDRMLGELGIEYPKLDIFITHDHPDHSGLAADLQQRGARVFMNPEEQNRRTDSIRGYLADEQKRRDHLRRMGVTAQYTPQVYDAFMEYMSRAGKEREDLPEFSFLPVFPGGQFHYGGYCFEVVPLKGHTFGQCGLYEKEFKLLFCGDQMMTTIVPIVSSLQTDWGLLKSYFDSMGDFKHVYADCHLLPSHYGPIKDAAAEADRIILGYLDKCEIMKDVLKKSKVPMTTREVGVRAYGRDDGPPDYHHFFTCTQIWAKTFSCLEYLYEEGFIERTEEEGIIYWRAGSHLSFPADRDVSALNTA